MTYKGQNGQFLTLSLFHETARELPEDRRAAPAVFSFDNDIPGLVNCRRTFLELEDPTGYEWAMKYLDSWEHFERLLNSTWFLPHYEDWKRELLISLKAKAIKRITAISLTGTNEAQALAASKYLAEKGWERNTRGRPSKDDMKGEMRRLSTQIEETNKDMDRIGLSVITGGKP